jgi:hypothetical protein
MVGVGVAVVGPNRVLWEPCIGGGAGGGDGGGGGERLLIRVGLGASNAKELCDGGGDRVGEGVRRVSVSTVGVSRAGEAIGLANRGIQVKPLVGGTRRV